tara:strand:- start:4718 stop:5500 length:783 start_codon:yes stop_codon:yes gene_type:complete
VRITQTDLKSMPRLQRAAFVNSLSGFKPANLVGSVDADGRTNLALMSSVVHLGSDPALLALIIRPGGEERHTLHNIMRTGVFSINHVTADIINAAHQTAARYPQHVCEFAATGLTPRWAQGFAAPLVAEAGVKLGLTLREHQRLAINDTHLVIGEIVVAELDGEWLNTEGGVDLHRAGSVALSGLDTYHAARPLKRMAYAKPDLPPREIALHGAANLDDSSTGGANTAQLTQTGDAALRDGRNSASDSQQYTNHSLERET